MKTYEEKTREVKRPAWSADGKKIAFYSLLPIRQRERVGDSYMSLMVVEDPLGQKPKRAEQAPPMQFIGLDSFASPVWAFDDEVVLFEGNYEKDAKRLGTGPYLYSADTASGSVRLTTEIEARTPQVCERGSVVFYLYAKPRGIYEMISRKGDVRLIVRQDEYATFVLSNSGTYVAYRTSTFNPDTLGFDHTLHVVERKSGEPTLHKKLPEGIKTADWHWIKRWRPSGIVPHSEVK